MKVAISGDLQYVGYCCNDMETGEAGLPAEEGLLWLNDNVVILQPRNRYGVRSGSMDVRPSPSILRTPHYKLPGWRNW